MSANPNGQRMPRAERHKQVVALKRTLTFDEIAAHLGLAKSTVTDAYYDPTGENARTRKARRHGTCCDCGTDTFNSGSEPPERCAICARPYNGEVQRERGRDIAERELALRRAGWTNAQIARELGVHPQSVSRSLARLRAAGVDVPPPPYWERGKATA